MVTQSERGSTEFRFWKPGAHQVFLVGDFNEWQECKVPMDRVGDDEWVCRLQLPQGVYRFRYLAGGGEMSRKEIGDGVDDFGHGDVGEMADVVEVDELHVGHAAAVGDGVVVAGL